MVSMLFQIEAHLKKQPHLWFAGGSEPTGADFMMSFTLERLVLRRFEALDGGRDSVIVK